MASVLDFSPAPDPQPYDPQRLRRQIPSLRSGIAHFDGPGGTQTPLAVATAIADSLLGPLSNRGTATVPQQRADSFVVSARLAIADLVGAHSQDVVFGRSMTQLTFDLARTLAQDWGPGDEVVVSRLDHDANIRPWVIAAERAGATIRWVDFDPDTTELPVEAFTAVVSSRTRLVAVTAASNLIGTRPDIAAISHLAHQSNALVFVDGVHLTAHSLPDVGAMGADFFVCSPYKFLGPHLGALVADHATLQSLFPDKLTPSTMDVPERFELGTLPYELLAGVTAAVDVLASLVPPADTASDETRRSHLTRSFAALETYEESLLDYLVSGLTTMPRVQIYSRAMHRTPTVLFSVDGLVSAEVSPRLADRNVEAPSGSFYALECSRHLGLGDHGAIRVGLAPYSTRDDVDRLFNALADLI